MLQALDIAFTNTTVCNPDSSIKKGEVVIENGKFAESNKNLNSLDLRNYIVYPGLFNGHDHLMGNYFPKIGNGPYISWKTWDEDLKSSPIFSERSNLKLKDVYLLAYYRLLLSGITSVCDHIPHSINIPLIPDAYVRIVDQYCIAHEISSYELAWGDSHVVEIARAKRCNIPFITHIEEGFDKESLDGVEILDEKGGLFDNTVLVHCIGCSKADIKKIASRKTHMVWCPISNLFMFKKTADIQTFLKEGVNVSLGTDSPMSGGLNMMEELKAAKKIFYSNHKKEIPDKTLMQMCTINPAKAFMLNDKVGSIAPGKHADVVVLKKNHADPYANLIGASIEDVCLVMRDGVLMYITEEMAEKYKLSNYAAENHEKTKLVFNKKIKYSYFFGKAMTLKHSMDNKLKFKKHLPFLPISTD